VVGIPNTSLTMIATGEISGPAGFDPAASEVTFFFGQKNGGYTMSGTVTTDLTGTAVPEPSTWALALAGFAGLAAVGLATRRPGAPSGLVRHARRASEKACSSVASAVSLAGLAPALLRRDGAARPCLRPESRSQSVAATDWRQDVRRLRHDSRRWSPFRPGHRPLGK
jgi:PEP-CTERM motif